MKKNGFTLLEVLFSLSILSLLILLTIPVQFHILDVQQEKQFFDTFESDMLYMQNISYASVKIARLTIDTEKHLYEINVGSAHGENSKPVIRRFPSTWKIDKRTYQGGRNISFNDKGTIRQPGKFTIQTDHAFYRIIFPLGKGRCYIEKE